MTDDSFFLRQCPSTAVPWPDAGLHRAAISTKVGNLQKIQSHITTVSRSVCLGVSPTSGIRYRCFFLLKIFFRQLRVCYFVAPSLTRGRVCNLLLLLGLASAVSLDLPSLMGTTVLRGPTDQGFPSPRSKKGTDLVSGTFVFSSYLEFRTMDEVQKRSVSECMNSFAEFQHDKGIFSRTRIIRKRR
jgi:hypothetical protein